MEIQANSIEEFMSILDRKINLGVRHAAIKIGDQINEIFLTAINRFYSDYSPTKNGPYYYKRTGSLKKAFLGIGGRNTFYKQLSQKKYIAGGTLGSENIPGEPYEKNPPHGWYMSKWLVFDRSYNEGIHGFSAYDIKLYNKGRGKDEGRIGFKTIPKKSSPPVKEVNKKYKNIKKTGNEILRQEINNAFGGQVC